MTGNRPQELEAIPIPPGCELIWKWFCMISAKRHVGMAPCPISDSEIIAFFKKHRITPEPWELGAIDVLDNLLLQSQREK